MAFNYSPKPVIDSSLVLYLDAANPRSYVSGSSAWMDISRGGNNGALTNGPTYNGANGGSIVFDGTNDYSSIGIVNQISTIAFISAWIKLNDINDDYRIFGFGNSNTTVNQLIFYGTQTNKPLGLSTFNNDCYGIDSTQNNNYLSDWINITFGIYSNSYNSTIIYINGTNITTSQKIGTSINRVFNNTFTLGTLSYSLDAGWYLKGNIANIQIYNRALSASEVLQNYNALKGRFGLR